MTRGDYYPVFLNLAGRLCVVIGGGLIAQRKVTTLLAHDAQVTVISPTVTQRLATYARQGRVRHIARRFKSGDLKGAWLAVAATDDQPVNEAVSRAAVRQRIFVNVVDQKPLCSFIAPSIVRRGDLTIAISTAGGSPALAKKLRRDLTQTIGADYGKLLRVLKNLRGAAKAALPTYNDRKRYFDKLIEQGRVFTLVRRGHLASARREALATLKHSAGKNDGTSW